jgi:dihydrofolate synthase/folylpolyglutamate synthase
LALAGAHQVINTSLALAALELLAHRFPVAPEALVRGLQQVRWPGRMELLTRTVRGKTFRVLLDGAHNEAGVSALHQSLTRDYPRRRLLLIWGNMADKQMQSALMGLIGLAALVIFTRSESLRSAAPAALQEQVPLKERAKTRCAETVELALEMAMDSAEAEDLICIAGSLYLVGRARHLLAGTLAP